MVSSAEWEEYGAGVYRFFPESGDWEVISGIGRTPSRMTANIDRLLFVAPSESYASYQVYCHNWSETNTIEGDTFTEFLTDIQLDSTGDAWLGAHWGWNDIENAQTGLHRIDSSCQRVAHVPTLLAPFRFVVVDIPQSTQ